MPAVLLRMWSMGSGIVYCSTVLLQPGHGRVPTLRIAGSILAGPFIKIRKDYARFVC